MIDRNGWVAWAVKKPGPADKVYSAPNSIEGLALHSQEGWQAGSESRLFSGERLPNGRYTRYAAASWHFSVLRTGEVRQHYPLPKSTWTSSSVDWNTRYPSIEAEGVFSQPLTDAQVQAILRLMGDVEQKYGVMPKREQPGRTLHEHRENPAIVGTRRATACPSERYRPLYAVLATPEEDEMTPEERARLERVERLLGGYGVKDEVDGSPTKGETLRGEDALKYLDKTVNMSVPLTVQRLNEALGDHTHEGSGLPSGARVTFDWEE